MTLTQFNGKVTMNDGVVTLNPVSVNAFGGSMAANGTYSTAESTTSPKVAMALDIKKAKFEETFKQLDMIQQMVPIFAKTGGTYSVSLDMNSRLDEEMSPVLQTLSAKGNLQSNDIHIQNIEAFDQIATLLKYDKLRNIEAKDVNIAFTITDGRVKTSPFDIKLGNTKMTLSGTTGLDQTIDYLAVIDLSNEKMVGDYVGIVNANIGGTFTKPSIKLDVKDVVKKAVTNKVVETIAGKGSNEEQIANIRRQAEEAGQKLVDAAKNPVGKIAAEASKKKLVEEAKKQAAKLADEAEAQIKKLQGE